jgi:hypothetical protein
MENKKFKKGDFVIEKGKSEPIMTIKGSTIKASNPENIVEGEYTCYWVDLKGENWVSIHESKLKHYTIS